MVKLSDILDRLKAYHPKPDLDLVKKAYVYADKAHKGQMRKSGEPYLIHPLEVALLITELKLDEASICAGLLHDVVEDTPTTKEELAELFTEEIAALVDGVTKLGKLQFNSKEQHQAENFRKMLLAMSRDIRVILVKLADRLHNMRTLQHMRPEKQVQIASETIDIYAPLANRLGISWLKAELEDLSFKYMNPDEYADIVKKMSKKRKERERYTNEVVQILREKLGEQGLQAEVSGRYKHFWGIYRKMKLQNLDFEEIYDLIGFRLIVEHDYQCYEALGLVHAIWKPVVGRFKDYIAVPKPNSYQSLHTTVVGPAGELVEIQIRTAEMHQVAELGVAAHWKYKEGGRPIVPKDEGKFAWLRQLLEWQHDLQDPTEFLESLRIDLFADEVFVYTPRGDVKALPAGATPVDFAYLIHTEVGHKCSGAKVNGQMVPLRHELQNGDVVEIITSPNQKPNKDWLKFVCTSRAKNKIRMVIRQEQRDRSRLIGRNMLEKRLQRAGLSLNRFQKSGELLRAAADCKCGSIEELMLYIGYGKVKIDKVMERLVGTCQTGGNGAGADGGSGGAGSGAEVGVNGDGLGAGGAEGGRGGLFGFTEKAVESKFASLLRKLHKQEPTGVTIQDMDDVLIRFAKCCAPVPGDDIVGFVTRGRGVTIHQRLCPQAVDMDPERKIEVRWDGKVKARSAVSIRVVCSDKTGLLAGISNALTQAGVHITQAVCRTSDDKKAVNTFEILVQDLDQLRTVMRNIARLDGVFSVERVQS